MLGIIKIDGLEFESREDALEFCMELLGEHKRINGEATAILDESKRLSARVDNMLSTCRDISSRVERIMEVLENG